MVVMVILKQKMGSSGISESTVASRKDLRIKNENLDGKISRLTS